MRFLSGIALFTCFAVVVAGSNPDSKAESKLKEKDEDKDEASVLEMIINDRLKAQLPEDGPSKEQVDRVKEEIVSAATDSKLCFEKAALDNVNELDLVSAWDATQP